MGKGAHEGSYCTTRSHRLQDWYFDNLLELLYSRLSGPTASKNRIEVYIRILAKEAEYQPPNADLPASPHLPLAARCLPLIFLGARGPEFLVLGMLQLVDKSQIAWHPGVCRMLLVN